MKLIDIMSFRVLIYVCLYFQIGGQLLTKKVSKIWLTQSILYYGKKSQNKDRQTFKELKIFSNS